MTNVTKTYKIGASPYSQGFGRMPQGIRRGRGSSPLKRLVPPSISPQKTHVVRPGCAIGTEGEWLQGAALRNCTGYGRDKSMEYPLKRTKARAMSFAGFGVDLSATRPGMGGANRLGLGKPENQTLTEEPAGVKRGCTKLATGAGDCVRTAGCWIWRAPRSKVERVYASEAGRVRL